MKNATRGIVTTVIIFAVLLSIRLTATEARMNRMKMLPNTDTLSSNCPKTVQNTLSTASFAVATRNNAATPLLSEISCRQVSHCTTMSATACRQAALKPQGSQKVRNRAK